jgi:V-type H+-transporting ATPase subunit a
MGFFSFYCGLIYNEFLSINLNLFGSCYQIDNASIGKGIEKYAECVYPFGLDPVWNVATNYLNYINSLKMKIAVIIGVIHMLLGIIVKSINLIHFKQWLPLLF